MPEEPTYDNIRQLLGGLIGQRLVDITEREHAEIDPDPEGWYLVLHFESGTCLQFPVPDGFEVLNSGGEVPHA